MVVNNTFKHLRVPFFSFTWTYISDRAFKNQNRIGKFKLPFWTPSWIPRVAKGDHLVNMQFQTSAASEGQFGILLSGCICYGPVCPRNMQVLWVAFAALFWQETKSISVSTTSRDFDNMIPTQESWSAADSNLRPSVSKSGLVVNFYQEQDTARFS